jgi:type IV pilus assembly protein PilQ
MGNLFKNTNRTAQRTELMIFLTPRIVSDDLRLR